MRGRVTHVQTAAGMGGRRVASLLTQLAAVGLFALAPGCGGGKSAEQAKQPDQAAKPAGADSSETLQKKEKAIKVNVADVRQGDLVISIHADGVIRTPRSVEVRAKSGGELTEVLVRDGDRARAGQVLARVDQREYALRLEDARYRHLQALSRASAEGDTVVVNREALDRYTAGKRTLEERLARGELAREAYQAEVLALELGALEQGAFRQQVYEQRTGLAEARMAEDRALLDLEYCEIRAPFDGIIQGVGIVPGEMVSAGTRICSIYNIDLLEAVVNVLEADLGNLETGRPALVAVPATGDTLRVQVDVISPNLDQASRTCEVILRFRNENGRFRPGMFAQAEIAGWVHHDKLQVPKDAVLLRDNRPLVFKVVGDRAQWLYVDIGLQNDEWSEITAVHSGGSLAPGEQVVVSDHLTLAHEALIEIRKSVTPPDRWGLASYAGQ
jgi:RND family efflux transporter MFP subunit